MIEIKAYVHGNRIAEVIAALKASAAWATAGPGELPNLAVCVVKGLLIPVDDREREYSLQLGDEVVNEYKLELLCRQEHVNEIVRIIRDVGRTGQATAGWVYVMTVQEVFPIA